VDVEVHLEVAREDKVAVLVDLWLLRGLAVGDLFGSYRSLLQLPELAFKPQILLAGPTNQLDWQFFISQVRLMLCGASLVLDVRHEVLLLEEGDEHQQISRGAQVGLGAACVRILLRKNWLALLRAHELLFALTHQAFDPQKGKQKCC